MVLIYNPAKLMKIIQFKEERRLYQSSRMFFFVAKSFFSVELLKKINTVMIAIAEKLIMKKRFEYNCQKIDFFYFIFKNVFSKWCYLITLEEG